MPDLSVSATFDLLGIEDLAVGEGTFTRSTATGGTQTITKINAESLGINTARSVKDYGAVGDGVTDDRAAIQAAFDDGGDIYFPEGTYLLARGPVNITVDNTHVYCAGTLKLKAGALHWNTDDEPAPSIVLINDALDVTWFGGTLDGNNVEGANGMAVSHNLFFEGTEGAYCYRASISGLTIKNCIHNTDADPGGDTPHDYGIGQGGGKALTIQFGAPQVHISDIRIYDSTIGISHEAGTTYERETPDLMASNITVRDCMIGLLLRGTFGATAGTDYGVYAFSSMWSNILFLNCGVANEPSGVDVVAENFGVIDAPRATNVYMTNLLIRNEAEIVTPFRGIFRNCKFTGAIDARQISRIIDFRRNTNGSDPTWTDTNSRHNEFDLLVKVHGAGTPGDQITNEMITDAGSSYQPNYNRFKFSLLIGDGANDYEDKFSELTSPLYDNTDSDDLPSDNVWEVFDRGSGKIAMGTGIVRNVSLHHLDGMDLAMPVAGQFNNNNLTWENDDQAGIVRIRSADESSKVGLGNNAGSTVAYADTLGLVVGDGTWNGRHLMLGGYHLWVASDKLYIKSSAPANATDGTVVGTQS